MPSSACISRRRRINPASSPVPAAPSPDISGAPFVIIIRSVVFNVLFYLVLVPYLVVAMPTLLLPRWGIIRLAQHWGRVNLHLLRIVCGITVEWRGLGKIPAGPCLVAAKHQSGWETFPLLTLFRDRTC